MDITGSTRCNSVARTSSIATARAGIMTAIDLQITLSQILILQDLLARTSVQNNIQISGNKMAWKRSCSHNSHAHLSLISFIATSSQPWALSRNASAPHCLVASLAIRASFGVARGRVIERKSGVWGTKCSCDQGRAGRGTEPNFQLWVVKIAVEGCRRKKCRCGSGVSEIRFRGI